MQPLDCQEVLLCSFPQVQLVCVAETGLSLSKLLRLDAACLLELVNIGAVSSDSVSSGTVSSGDIKSKCWLGEPLQVGAACLSR